MKKSNVYYYIKFSENGNSVTGYKIVKDTNLAKLKKQWLSEVPGNVTPISEGIEFERPKRKLTPEEQSAIEFAKVFSRNAIGSPSKRTLDKSGRPTKEKRRVFRLWAQSGKHHKPGETNGRSRKI